MSRVHVTTAMLSALAALASSVSFSQVLPDAGQTLRELERPSTARPLSTQEAPRLQVPEEQAPAAAADEQRIAVKTFRVIGAKSFSAAELEALLLDWNGKDLTLSELQRAANRITQFYRERDFLVARAIVPAQTLQDGAVRIVVLEGQLGKLEVRNQARLKPERVEEVLSDLKPDVPLSRQTVEQGLLALNDLPGIERVSAALRPGASAGFSDLVVSIDPVPLVTGSIDADNHGNRFTGQYRLGTTLFLNSPFYLGDQFNARMVASNERLYYGRVAYRLPVGGTGFTVGSAYTASVYHLGQEFAVLDASGDSHAVSLFGTYSLLRKPTGNLTLALSFDHKSLQDRIAADQTDKSVRSATLGLVGNFQSADIAANFSLGYTQGKLNIETPKIRANDADSARTQGGFGKWTLTANGIWALSGPWSLYGALSAQFAHDNLDSSEKFVLGGVDAVRAYPQGEASADEGYVVSTELRYAVPTSQLGTLQFGVFVDHGWVRMNHTPFSETDNIRALSAAGLSLNWNAPLSMLLRASLAWKLGSEAPRSDRDRVPRGWLQMLKYF